MAATGRPASRADMARLPTALVLDMDGVIADTERLSLQAFADTYADHGVPLDERDVHDLLGLSIVRVDRLVRDRHPVPIGFEQMRDEYRARYVAHLERGVPPCDGVLPLLEGARAAGVPVAVASSSPRNQIELVLASTGAAPLVREIAAGDEVAATKPAPDLYLLALERLRVRAPGAIAVEDSPAGLAAALAAGLPCVGVRNGAAGTQELAGAVLEVDSLAELTIELLGELAHR